MALQSSTSNPKLERNVARYSHVLTLHSINTLNHVPFPKSVTLRHSRTVTCMAVLLRPYSYACPPRHYYWLWEIKMYGFGWRPMTRYSYHVSWKSVNWIQR